MFTEALSFLIEAEHNPKDMMHLGGYYYEIKKFDLALKYYELAVSYDYDPAYECLGYIWYYGRTGERDYNKAFEYFSRLMEKGDPVSTYKIADMYKNGYYVEQNYEKYKEIIEDLYPKVRKARTLGGPVPEVFTRLAMIRKEDGRINDAIRLLLEAKDFQARRLKNNAFFGDINIMKWLIDDLYEMLQFNTEDFDLFDCMWLLRGPARIHFNYEGMRCTISAAEENGELAIRWQKEIYPDRDAFFAKAMLGKQRLMSIYDELYGFGVE